MLLLMNAFLRFESSKIVQSRINKHETIGVEKGMQRVAEMHQNGFKLGAQIDMKSENIGKTTTRNRCTNLLFSKRP